MSRALRVILAAGLLVGLAGCARQVDAPLSPTFGQAVAAMDNQIIDPTPAVGIPMTSGPKAAAAIERYEQDRVKEPGGGSKEAKSGGDSGDSSGESGDKSGAGSGEQKQ